MIYVCVNGSSLFTSRSFYIFIFFFPCAGSLIISKSCKSFKMSTAPSILAATSRTRYKESPATPKPPNIPYEDDLRVGIPSNVEGENNMEVKGEDGSEGLGVSNGMNGHNGENRGWEWWYHGLHWV